FVGTSSKVCKRVFDKFIANEYIKEHGFHTLPSVVLRIYQDDHKSIVNDFFEKYNVERAVVKPARGGSSIGVFSVANKKEALKKVQFIFSKRMDTRVVIEPFAQGVEFTSIILQNRFGIPVTVLPTEIHTDYTEHQIFDYRKKYLPTRQVTYQCPPSFGNDVIEKIQIQAEQLFSLFGMSDFARFDGWVLNNGEIWFSDFNPISGMEQNSFLFQQASRIGMSHADVLRFIVKIACQRQGVVFPEMLNKQHKNRKPVHVLFGGETSERQVSLMSGTNVWLKLRRSKIYEPKPYLLGSDGNVWSLPYSLTLNHTVEEIEENCVNAEKNMDRLRLLERRVQKRLGLVDGEATQEISLPERMRLSTFIKKSPFVFIALHGGDGESGVLQKKLLDKNVKYNGSGEKVSRFCMDKLETGKIVSALDIKGVSEVPKKRVLIRDLEILNKKELKEFWEKTCGELGSKTLIVKPRSDGCSSGIVRLYTYRDLECYLQYVLSGVTHIPRNTFKNQSDRIEMPSDKMKEILLEYFVDTDMIRVKENKLKYKRKTGWVEATVGVLEKSGDVNVFNPSITVAEGEVLTVEEKFQGGTGINITPPPQDIVHPKILMKVKKRIGALVGSFGIHGYVRVDVFIHIDTGNIMIIEFNSLPALTPSTVLYQQALVETAPMYPRELLEHIIKNAGY
ncbi:MAG: hypothetical protein KAS07_03500, partial [Candidatus Pacebacteria bacterium]|nr:hypothetical protein [Candidatus Paceibacterota bacterium]